ncbi:hypothetical protein GGR53DRAFT_222754 [Hypoxylon sp. FL1150]|nr:hypothetical protein GGR53DRAFT_222754 [Hypoxylon sp. FL1150]
MCCQLMVVLGWQGMVQHVHAIPWVVVRSSSLGTSTGWWKFCRFGRGKEFGLRFLGVGIVTVMASICYMPTKNTVCTCIMQRLIEFLTQARRH